MEGLRLSHAQPRILMGLILLTILLPYTTGSYTSDPYTTRDTSTTDAPKPETQVHPRPPGVEHVVKVGCVSNSRFRFLLYVDINQFIRDIIKWNQRKSLLLGY